MKIKYLISSHKSYVNITVDRLVISLIDSGISSNDIYLVIGGSDYVENYDNKFNIEVKYTSDNSYDLTSLIDVCKHDKFEDYDYLFLLHDTCEVTSKFKDNLLSQIDTTVPTIAAFGYEPSSNIGLYKRDYISIMKNFIIDLQNKSKSDYVKYEDNFLVNKGNFHFTKHAKIIDTRPIYNDNTLRQIVYCDTLELYKYKANWYVRDWVIEP